MLRHPLILHHYFIYLFATPFALSHSFSHFISINISSSVVSSIVSIHTVFPLSVHLLFENHLPS